MGEKLVIGPINRGVRTDRTAFNIDNDSFPTMINAYQWRGRVKRKRGTTGLTRLKRYFDSSNISYYTGTTPNLAGGELNLLSAFSLQTNSSIVPGSVSLTIAGNVYTDNSLGILTGAPAGSGTINYASSLIQISGGGASAVLAAFSYYPSLPVLGDEDLVSSISPFPLTLLFDQTYSYQITQTIPAISYDVSFYKNAATNAYPGYVQKINWTPVTWNGFNYQQFWSVNYQGAFWATNGIDVPFAGTNIGMQFKLISGISVTTAGNGTTIPAVANITITAHGLVIGDFVFINEVVGITGINFQTGYVTAVPDANTITVTFPYAILGGAYSSGGIAQYLTSRSDPSKDCIRWYDGSPVNGAYPPSFVLGSGWVNFCPPLSQGIFSISDEVAAQYYLVSARMIIPFKGYLVFLGPVIQTSTANSLIYLQDTIIYSQNGTPYYTCSFSGDVNRPTFGFKPILAPSGFGAAANAYFEDQNGYGGSYPAGIDQPITTAAFNEDALIVGFSKIKTRLVFTGNQLGPFEFFSINTEYGASSVFSVVTMDKGVIDRGDKGFTMTSQTDCERIDLDNPEQVFQLNYSNNGRERFCSVRDFINEWVFFTYPSVGDSENPASLFPNQTFMWNYRDNSWSIIDECYTTYGTFISQSNQTWLTLPYENWNKWDTPWNSGENNIGNPLVTGGNQQGFVLIKDDDTTGEDPSLYIQSFSGSRVVSPNHCLNNNDYILIKNCLGTIGDLVNNKIFQVYDITTNDFALNPTIGTGTYIGSGTITRIYVPLIQTKQFPVAWDTSRKTRLGPQQYLLTKTDNAQITLLIFLSQNASDPYNLPPIVPQIGSTNNSLIYSTVLYTCPESTNLGLTPANINLQTPTAQSQAQIWHRKNTSLIGDTVQIGFTLNDEQVRDQVADNAFSEIELHSIILDVQPSQLLV